MYFLTSEERQKLVRGLLPKARQMEISDELRGWNWNQPPLEAMYEEKLALYEIAGKYCPTGRDLYLRKVEGVKTEWNQAMIQGKVLHDTLAELLVKAKKLMYCHGIEGQKIIIEKLQEVSFVALEKWESKLDQEFYLELKEKIKLMWQFEYNQLVVRMQGLLAKQPYIGVDSLVNLTIPIVVEQKLDGSFLGLSSYLSADAFNYCEPMILDLKFGKPKDFHKLTITGYALVMESIYSYPVSVGCLVYPEFRGDRIVVKKEFEIIDDELRQWFIEERDEKMRMVCEEIDPEVAQNCYQTCPYYEQCY
ncbi:CRISPR-associated protein Cas4/Csa1, subtype I-A/APERN [Halobacteroides halobius DSM 5150]|uniref:CRISPR-associated protein Cas4/Csa1, subtype I-A/APERN n=1 Tax=Halobacteroides halobius (strain ATCC 35273 / DSM 5150 / MD-1) TaxID=748449 RepID=L0K8Q1_HALHC|nr:type I-A CRISPR-associated protein Cas4/Csa1 [Halobacteroides halobius]AGB40915.1 CRISPR-associated protein Cas4/Csa1, subtype I-A/APERN [Halobacteroides halobius DSM 5150]